MPGDPGRLRLDGKRYVVAPEDDYERLVEDGEMSDAVARLDRAQAEFDAGEDEIIPGVIADRLFAGENPVRVWREYWGLTQVELAGRAGVDRTHLSCLESSTGHTRSIDCA